MRRIGLACLALLWLAHVPAFRRPPVWEEIARTNTLVWFDFADGSLADAGGRMMLRASAMSGGEVTLVPRAEDWALEFPPVCGWAPNDCPRIVLESEGAEWLNPDIRPARWGASVRLTPRQVSEGANIVQKGLSSIGTQFKLQADGAAGHPSCVIAGQVDGIHHIFVALSPYGVADGAWHDLVCERAGGVLRLFIDGMVAAETILPVALSIVNDLPLRVGGKGNGPYNDQFHGAIDNVFVEIG